MKILQKILISSLLLIIFSVVEASVSKDSDGVERMTGVELKDFSSEVQGSILKAIVSQNEQGLFVYDYSLKNPQSNEGIINSLRINIHCNYTPENSEKLKNSNTDLQKKYQSFDANAGNHSLVAVSAEYEMATYYGVSDKADAYWVSYIRPGEEINVRLISPQEPIIKSYTLIPALSDEVSVFSDPFEENSAFESNQRQSLSEGKFTRGLILTPGCNTPDGSLKRDVSPKIYSTVGTSKIDPVAENKKLEEQRKKAESD